MNQEFVSVATFLITVCMVYDFSGAFREAMDLRHMLEQAEQLMAELEQRAAEKKRLLEAASTFAKEAVSEKLADTKEALAERLPSVETPDPGQAERESTGTVGKRDGTAGRPSGAAERTDNQRSLMVSDPQPGFPVYECGN